MLKVMCEYNELCAHLYSIGRGCASSIVYKTVAFSLRSSKDQVPKPQRVVIFFLDIYIDKNESM